LTTTAISLTSSVTSRAITHMQQSTSTAVPTARMTVTKVTNQLN
jgi:hypothetical protein